VLTILPATTAWAQGSPETQTVRQVVLTPEMVLQLAQADTTHRPDAASPSDAIIEPSPARSAACEPACSRCGQSSACGCGAAPAPANPWTIPQPCCLQRHGIRIGGWLEQGITFNSVDPGDRSNGPVATNDIDSEYQMNQMWMYIDRPVKTDGSGWDIGGHVDIMYGTDWRFGINHGLEDRINGFNRQTYGTVIPQAYVEIAYNYLSVKLGHFAAILDYEVVPAIFNPFYSHSYSYGFGVPQLVTGALGDYKLTDQFSIQAGFTRGWSMFEDFNEELDFMGGVKWQSADKRTSLRYALSTGPQDYQPLYPTSGENNRFVYSFVGTHKFTERFEYVLVHNLGNEDNGTPIMGEDAEWYSLLQYFRYTLNPRWQANLRFEWMRDDDGARIAGPGNIPGVRAWDGWGFAGNFFELTLGTIWRPTPNLMFRPELRWDWYNGLPNPVNGDLPFDGGNGSDQLTIAADLILTF
jgi:hypothetical protein